MAYWLEIRTSSYSWTTVRDGRTVSGTGAQTMPRAPSFARHPARDEAFSAIGMDPAGVVGIMRITGDPANQIAPTDWVKVPSGRCGR
jgi:hypothetical protein